MFIQYNFIDPTFVMNHNNKYKQNYYKYIFKNMIHWKLA